MLTEPLTTTLDVRKAAVRGADVSGILKPLDLKRFRPLLGSEEGRIAVEMAFSRDDENRYLVQVKLEADIVVTCQRCLEAMPEHVSCVNTLAIVWTDEEAVHLPRHLDPLVVGDISCSLWDVVEDELILTMRPFSYHDIKDCKMKIADFQEPIPRQETGEDKPNPFNVLGLLKPGNRH
jgi:uncharacterized protein